MQVLADKTVHFVLLTDIFTMFICKTIKTSTWKVNNNSFLGKLKRRAPEHSNVKQENHGKTRK